MEPPIPRNIDLDLDRDMTRPIALKRKDSTLQTSVEVMRCKFGKPAASPEGHGEFKPSKDWTPIYYAVYYQREAALSHFLRAGATPNDVTGLGLPPLCIAIANGHASLARILLDAGADADAAMKNSGETALHLAVKHGRSDLIELLIPYGPNLETKTQESKDTPLHYAAAKSGSLATVMTLLKHGANYEALNVRRETPAEAALHANNIQGAVAIINAAHGKRHKLEKEREMLLKHVQKTEGRFSMGNDLIADIFTAACDADSNVLVEAIKRDDASLVEMFLEKGSDPDRETANGLRPIFVALECAGAPVIFALLKRNPDLTIRDRKGLTILQATFESPLAQEKETLSIILGALLEQGADATVTYPDGKTLLHHAVSSRFTHPKIAHQLIAAGAEINARDQDGDTPLHLATHNRTCTELLLKHKANPDLTNADELTPLLNATTNSTKDNEPDVESLIKASDLRKTNVNGQTALHLAAANGLERTVQSLLRARANIAIGDKDKNTPLLLAVKHHQWSIVPLLTIPPSINSWDEDGMSPLHLIASTVPKAPATWNDIAAIVGPFCERGVSRTTRERSGATPLILAIKTLPEDGLPVVEALLAQKADRKASRNCVNHEDHKKQDALFYAVTMGKPVFVDALLKHGASFDLEDWIPGTSQLQPSVETDKQILKIFAQYEWMKRAGSLRRRPSNPVAEVSSFSTMLPVKDLEHMIAMGLDVNALPRSALGVSLICAVLRHITLQPPMPPDYVLDVLNLVLDGGANPNAGIPRSSRRSPSSQSASESTQTSVLIQHPLTFLLEECPDVAMDVVSLLLARGAQLTIASPFSKGRLPLHSAVKVHRFDIVQEFLLHGADVNAVDQYGRTPLYVAAQCGDWEIANSLLRSGASMDTLDVRNNTLLHAAAVGGSKKIVASLLREGATAHVKNADGLTPMACVGDNYSEEERSLIVAMLKEAEDNERKDEHAQRQRSDAAAAQEARDEQLKDEEAKAKLQQEQEAKTRIQKANEEAAAQRLPHQPQQSLPAPMPTSPPPRVTRKPSFLSRKTSLFFNKSKATPPPLPSDTLPKPKQTSMLRLRINTPPTFKQPPHQVTELELPVIPNRALPSPHILASPDFFSTDFNDKMNPRPVIALPAAIQRRTNAARVDSGLSERRSSSSVMGILDLEKVNEKLTSPQLGCASESQRESNSELADWLALTKMMDGL
jgi:ankyrin repeat protein